ncbi:hypothetical protein SNE510_67190 [Streptomyces sp. NE5-10]|nr:hypothetical protein SNE510_67190 [Streptomyces sp. NE5-10]
MTAAPPDRPGLQGSLLGQGDDPGPGPLDGLRRNPPAHAPGAAERRTRSHAVPEITRAAGPPRQRPVPPARRQPTLPGAPIRRSGRRPAPPGARAPPPDVGRPREAGPGG